MIKLNENTDDSFAEDSNSQTPTPSQPGSQVAVSKDLLMKVGAGAAALVVVLGLVFFVVGNQSDSRLSDAVASCGLDGASGITFAEDGQSLVFDGKGEEDFTGGEFSDVECLLTGVEAPSTVWAQMLQTSSADGQQEFEFDGISVSWGYHPNSGLDTTFVILD